MALLPKYLNHDQPFACVEHTGVTDFADLKAKVEAHATANGFSLANNVLTSDLTTSVRNDVDHGLEKVNIKLLSDTFETGQRDNAGTLEGLVLSKDLSTLSYPLDLTVITDGQGDAVPVTTPYENAWFMNGDVSTTAPDAGGTIPLDAIGSPATSPSSLSTSLGDMVTLDGSTQYFKTPGNAPASLVPNGAFAYHFWVTMSGTLPALQMLFSLGKDNAGVDSSFKAFIDSAGQLRWRVSQDGGVGSPSEAVHDTPTGTLVASQTHFISCVYDGQVIYVFVDGAQTAQTATPGLEDFGSPGPDIHLAAMPFEIGSGVNWNGITNFEGDIHAAYFTPGTFTLADHQLAYANGVDPIEDWSESFDASMLELVADEGTNPPRHFCAGLSNRERAQWNMKLAAGQTLNSGNLTVTVDLPKDSEGNYFYPKMYDPGEANFKDQVLIYSQTTSDVLQATIDAVANISTIAGTADVTFSGVTSESFGPGSLLGLNPQPLLLLEGEIGETIETGAIEAITLTKLGARRDANGDPNPPGAGERPDVLFYGYGTSEAALAGRVLGMRGLDTTESISDKQTGPAWKADDPVLGRSEGKSRLYEVRQVLNQLSSPPTHSYLANEDAATTTSSGLVDLPESGLSAQNMSVIVSSTGLGSDTGKVNSLADGAVRLSSSAQLETASLTGGAEQEFVSASDEFSYAFWIYFNSNPANEQNNIPNMISGTTFTVYAPQASPGPGVRVLLGDSAGGFTVIPVQTVTLGTWNHFMVTFDGAVGRMYLNGQLASTTPLGGTGTLQPMTSGGKVNLFTSTSDHLLDQLLFNNKVWTRADAQLLYAAGAPVVEDVRSGAGLAPIVLPKTNYAV